MGKNISLNKLSDEKYREILCYPKFKEKEFEIRLIELKKLGVRSIEFSGEKKIQEVPILGKGCVGIVVIAHTNIGKTALKIRRIDSDRKDMYQEGNMLSIANSINVGPKLYKTSKNFLIMELIKGKPFFQWIEIVGKTVKDQKYIHSVIEDISEQCYRLDKVGLDHGELTNASKHIIIDQNNLPYLVDFESASINRRVSNITSICQYLFLGNQIKIKKIEKQRLIEVLQKYKQKRTRNNFIRILKCISN